jgi:hypothetical protein
MINTCRSEVLSRRLALFKENLMASGHYKRVITKGGKVAHIQTVQRESGEWAAYTSGAVLAAFAPGITFPSQRAAEEAAMQALEQAVFGGDPIYRIEELSSESAEPSSPADSVA